MVGRRRLSRREQVFTTVLWVLIITFGVAAGIMLAFLVLSTTGVAA